MPYHMAIVIQAIVAPARERGLKYLKGIAGQNLVGRSLEGAWIEIL